MKISVVTPSYNQLSYLKLCAASIADQGVELEHIIQDAGTVGDLETWAASQTSVRLFVEKDGGMYDAINRGLQRATGDICAYLNCDEQYLPGALGRVLRFFEQNPEVDVVFGDVILVDSNGSPLSYRRVIRPTLEHVRVAHLNTSTCATFFRRTLLDRDFYFDSKWRVIGDVVWVAALLENNVAMATIPEPLSVFTFTGENLGATAASQAETLVWRRSFDYENKGSFGEALLHRIRKAIAGAYLPRKVAIDVFTLTSPQRRDHRVAHVGFHWPKS